MFGENPFIFIYNMVVIWSEIQLRNPSFGDVGTTLLIHAAPWIPAKKNTKFVGCFRLQLDHWTTSQAGYDFLDLEKQKKRRKTSPKKVLFF